MASAIAMTKTAIKKRRMGVRQIGREGREKLSAHPDETFPNGGCQFPHVEAVDGSSWSDHCPACLPRGFPGPFPSKPERLVERLRRQDDVSHVSPVAAHAFVRRAPLARHRYSLLGVLAGAWVRARLPGRVSG